MSGQQSENWFEANRRYLTAALGLVREALERHTARANNSREESLPPEGFAGETLEEAQRALPAPAALQTLCAAFGLSAFERDLLLLCAGIELDSRCATICAAAQGDRDRRYPTFSRQRPCAIGASSKSWRGVCSLRARCGSTSACCITSQGCSTSTSGLQD
jgi:Winged helix domain, variant